MPTELLEPVVSDGVRLTHFFNGRVLTAEDLRREQDAGRDRHRGLAGAVGDGVVRGLEVSILKRDLPAPTVRVTAGLAFNRDGDPVQLPTAVELRLIPATAETDPEAGIFNLCQRTSSASVITNPGFYVLAARPASALSREQVPMVDLSSEGVGSRCGSRYTETGASFSLVSLPLPAGGAEAPLAKRLTEISKELEPLVELVRGGAGGNTLLEMNRRLSLLRNGMAYWIAGRDAAGGRVVSLAPAGSAPAGPPAPLEALRSSGALASCDVPLALLLVTRRRLEWVDLWSVRRAPVPRLAPEPLPLIGALPPAEAAAAFMQFRDHAASFLGGEAPLPAGQVRASDWFLFLPPAGVLPLAAGAGGGFTAATFFGGRPVVGPAAIPATRVPPLLHASLEHAPVSLETIDAAWTYTVSGVNSPGAPPCLLFTSYPLEPDLAVRPVRISQVVPSGPVHVGDPLRVLGENFEGLINAQQVLVDGVPVSTFSTRTDGELAFTIPTIPGLPEGGRSVLLLVSNRTTSAFRPLALLPRPEPVTGSLDVEFVLVAPSVPVPGQPAVFRFSLRNRTNRSAAVGLTATVSITAWQAALQILPAQAATVPITSVNLGVGEEISVFVRIPQIPVGSANTNFTLRLDGNANGVLGSSGSVGFKVGTAAEPDPGVSSLTFVSTNPSGARSGSLVSVTPYYPVQALFDVVVNVAGTYTATAQFVDTGGNTINLAGWNISIVGEESSEQLVFTVTQDDLNANNGQKTVQMQVVLVAYYGSVLNGEAMVRVQRTGQTVKRELRFQVQRTGWYWYNYGYGF